MIQIKIEYDEKYCSCVIDESNFKSTYLTVDELIVDLESKEFLTCSSPTFIEFYARPYADAMKSKKYVFNQLSLKIDVVERVKDLIVVSCTVVQRSNLKTIICLRIYEDL